MIANTAFSNILGQEGAMHALRRSIDHSRLAQSYLFIGPAGVGKATSALAFASALNCDEAPRRGCGSCEIEERIVTRSHPDLIWIERHGTMIGIEQIRQVIHLLRSRPHEARHRLVIVNGADELSPSAAAAMLKSIEEPFPRTLFVLISRSIHDVPSTLASRSQQIRFSPLRSKDIMEILRLRSSCRNEAAIMIASAMSQGSAGQALQLLEDEQALFEDRQILDQIFQAANEGRSSAMFAAASLAGKERARITRIIRLMRTDLRKDMLKRITSEYRADGTRFASDVAPRTAEMGSSVRLLQATDSALKELRNNANPLLILERVALALQRSLN